MSNESTELVTDLHPDGVDLVEFFGEDEEAVAAFMKWGPPDSFSDDFAVRFISETPGIEAEYRGLDGFVEGCENSPRRYGRNSIAPKTAPREALAPTGLGSSPSEPNFDWTSAAILDRSPARRHPGKVAPDRLAGE